MILLLNLVQDKLDDSQLLKATHAVSMTSVSHASLHLSSLSSNEKQDGERNQLWIITDKVSDEVSMLTQEAMQLGVVVNCWVYDEEQQTESEKPLLLKLDASDVICGAQPECSVVSMSAERLRSLKYRSMKDLVSRKQLNRGINKPIRIDLANTVANLEGENPREREGEPGERAIAIQSIKDVDIRVNTRELLSKIDKTKASNLGMSSSLKKNKLTDIKLVSKEIGVSQPKELAEDRIDITAGLNRIATELKHSFNSVRGLLESKTVKATLASSTRFKLDQVEDAEVEIESDVTEEDSGLNPLLILDTANFQIRSYKSCIDYLIGTGVLTERNLKKLEIAKGTLKQSKGIDLPIEDIAIVTKILDEATVIAAMSEVYGTDFISTARLSKMPVLTNVYPRNVCKKYAFIHTAENPRVLIGVWNNRLGQNLGVNYGDSEILYSLPSCILQRLNSVEEGKW